MEQSKYDLIIIGSGAAGLAAAQYGARSNLTTLVIESAATGGQVLNINNLENYPGIFPAVTGYDFIDTMKKQAEHFGAQFLQTTVISIDKIHDRFVVKTAVGELLSYTLLISTGATHRHLGIPGEAEFEGRGVSYCATCDGPFFRNKRIVVVGGGDAACDEAMYLSTLSGDVTLIHRKSQLRAQKAVADRVLNNSRIHVMFNLTVKEILGTGKVEKLLLHNEKNGEESILPADGVFIFVGMNPQTELVDMLKKDEAGYIVTDENMATAMPGLFCAGDLRSKSFRQIVTATSDGAIAAHSAEKYIRTLKNEVYV